jgi:outer membrane protein OmpA-like peptidoglycan-associated protein
LSFLGTYRKPLIGPLPYLYEGTEDNRGPTVLLPRARNDAFWVNFNNRQATIFKITLNFDPTPSSWLYLWQPNLLEAWNMNPKEDAGFALALQYMARKYPTTTDHWYYRNRNDDVLWEGEFDSTKEFWDYRPYGSWATNAWLHSFNAMIRLIPSRPYKFWVNLRWGQDVATYALAYTLKTNENKPITDFFLGTVSLDKKPYQASFTFGKDIWGPEDWHQGFGGTLDRLYKFSLSRIWEKTPLPSMDSTLGIEYVGCRETDNMYLYPELGPFDEWRLFYNLHFGSIFVFQEPEKKQKVQAAAVKSPPAVGLVIPDPVFTPGAGDNRSVELDLEAKDSKGIKSWEVNIYDADDNLIQSYQGNGEPPGSTDWDGTDIATSQVVAEGDYLVVFSATNLYDLSAKTEPQTVTLKMPQLEMAKEILKEAPVEITEEERGLVMNIKSAVLFDLNKYNLKSEALEVLPGVAKVINLYPENKLMIEGYTDSTGSVSYNQKLSERRAQSVYNYLLEQGVAADRMKMIGFGKANPIASNRTQQGRMLNRRVEIIILKNENEGIKVPIEDRTVTPQ